jgi:SAM-dependent methyltransferase
VALLDLNENSLDFTARRIARYRPERYQGNVLEPISLNSNKFDSIAVNYLLHCLPGTMETKAVALDHLRQWLNPGGVLFGSTLLTGGVERNRFARRLMEAYNKQGIFSNESDTLEGLEVALRQRFDDVQIEVVGCAALFSGRA